MIEKKETGNGETEPLNHWTIMVYMSGDNNLSVEMAYALENIKSAARESKKKVNLFVYFDGHSRSVPTLYCDFTDFANPVYTRSCDIAGKRYPVENQYNEDSSLPNSVLNFVDWCSNKNDIDKDGRKSNHYGLVFSGHSFGFQSVGMLKDDFTGNTMSLENVESVLGEINRNIIRQELDILGFDSCVMSMLEVGYQFRSFAKVMIASEGSVPSAGWTYTEILGRLVHDSETTSITDIGADFVREFIKKEVSYAIGGSAVDMAAWDLSKLEELNEPLTSLSQNLYDCFKDENSTLYKQMKRILSYIHKHCQSYMLNQNIDLGDFCEMLKSEVSSLKEELSLNFSVRLDSILKTLKARKDLENDLSADLDSLNELNAELQNRLNSTLNILKNRNDFNDVLDKQLNSINEKVDFELLDSIIKNCSGVLEKLHECVLLSGFSGGTYQFSNGISLFFPWSKSAFDVSKKDYRQLDFIMNVEAGKSWNKFLTRYLGKVTYRRSIANREDKADLIQKNHVWKPLQHLIGNDRQTGNKTAAPMTNYAADLVTANSVTKMGNNPTDKMGNNPTDKMGNNATDKMGNNAADKMLGSSGNYMESFTHLENTEMPWNVYGFTKKQDSENES